MRATQEHWLLSLAVMKRDANTCRRDVLQIREDVSHSHPLPAKLGAAGRISVGRGREKIRSNPDLVCCMAGQAQAGADRLVPSVVGVFLVVSRWFGFWLHPPFFFPPFLSLHALKKSPTY